MTMTIAAPQYSTAGYYIDSVTVPRAAFLRSLTTPPAAPGAPRSAPPPLGRFDFTLATPPGREGIELAAIVVSYPVQDGRQAREPPPNPPARRPPARSLPGPCLSHPVARSLAHSRRPAAGRQAAVSLDDFNFHIL